MKIFEHKIYLENLNLINQLDLPIEKLKNKSIVISGATGMIGSCLIDYLFLQNKKGLNCKVYALGRNIDKMNERFAYIEDKTLFEAVQYDINTPLDVNDFGEVDYVLHLASNTHPLQYATDPIGTITTNVFGTYHLLDFATKKQVKRCALASSIEIYGENRGDTDRFSEEYCGYINSNTLRAGYPESKRCSEALCQAFIQQNNLDVVILRLTRTFGPTMLMTDTKAMSQFILNAVNDEDIVLKSAGDQNYSFIYVMDAVGGILTSLLCGENGEAYNIAHETLEITLLDLARLLSTFNQTKVVFDLPSEVEKKGQSVVKTALLSSDKLSKLGWSPLFSLEKGLKNTVEILKDSV